MITDQTHREKSFSGNNGTHEMRPREWPLLNQSQTQQSSKSVQSSRLFSEPCGALFLKWASSSAPPSSSAEPGHHHSHYPHWHNQQAMNPQTTTKRPAMGRLGSEIPKCYQFLLGLRFLWEQWCCFLKKLVNEAIRTKTIAKTSYGGLTFKFLQTILLPELTEPSRTMIFTKATFFTLRHILPMRWDAKRNKKQAHLANEMIST